MFESQGTTPAEQVSTTPEPQPIPREMLEARIEELTRDKDYWHQKHLALETKVSQAEEAFKEILAGDTEATDIIDTYGKAMADHLGWEFTREVEIDITVTWRGTVSLPFGTDVEDLDIDDFGLNEPCHQEHDTNFYYGMHDYEIRER